MKKIINGEVHYIVYAVYEGENLKAWDLNEADWYGTLRDALDAIEEARGDELWAVRTGMFRDQHFYPHTEENAFAIMKVDLGPGANLWPVPVEVDTLGWQWAADEGVLRELEEAHRERDGEDW